MTGSVIGCLLFALHLGEPGGPVANAPQVDPAVIVSSKEYSSADLDALLQSALDAKQFDQVVTWLAAEKKAGRGSHAAKELMDRLSTKDPSLRWASARLMPRLGKDAITALPALSKAIDDSDQMVRWAAADAIRELAPLSDRSLQYLMPALENKDPLVRWSAVQSLAEMGPNAREATPILMQLLNDDSVVVRREAARTLRSVIPYVPSIGMQEFDAKANPSRF